MNERQFREWFLRAMKDFCSHPRILLDDTVRGMKSAASDTQYLDEFKSEVKSPNDEHSGEREFRVWFLNAVKDLMTHDRFKFEGMAMGLTTVTMDAKFRHKFLTMVEDPRVERLVTEWVPRNQRQLELGPVQHSSMGADFSQCRKYRYVLWRRWNPSRPIVVFIGLNPSTADETTDDPTVRRCINFARSWGYGGMYMLNIFGFRATDPKQMKKEENPIGPENDGYILDECTRPHVRTVVCAWGNHGSHMDRGVEVGQLLMERNVQLFCLGMTNGGQPKHPLYMSKDLKPIPLGTGRKKDTSPGQPKYYCSGDNCPGYPYKASDLPHPPTCR